MTRSLVPKLWTTLRAGYTRRQLFNDLGAGVIVGIVALPLAIAFAIASGVTPDRGLATAIVAGLLISALGGSRVQIGGPTGAFVVIVYGILQHYGLDGLMVATMMAGVLLIGLGVARLGGAIKFIPYPVVLGFTAGIAIIIFSSEVPDLLGLTTGPLPGNFVGRWSAFFTHAGSANPYAIAISAITVIVIVLWPRIDRRIPGPFVALIVTSMLVILLGWPVETIGSRFGNITAHLPTPHFPTVPLKVLPSLVQPAVTIALLAAVESLLSAVVADGMIGGRHRSNMELVAQGIANIASPIFGGIPATGAIARTATNVKNGGRTPVAGMAHALTLLLLVLVVGRYAARIPLATLAGILAVVAWHMSEARNFIAQWRAPRSDVLVLLTTFLLTVFVDLTVAVEVGMVLAAFLFMRRMAEVTNVSAVTDQLRDEEEDTDPNAVSTRQVPAGVEVYEINGPFFFGAAAAFREEMAAIARRPKILVLRLRGVQTIDATGLHALTQVVRQCKQDGTQVILSDVHAQPMMALARAGVIDVIGSDNLVGHVDEALDVARAHLGLPPAPRPAWTPTVARQERRRTPRG
ncbi:MAG TPA: SulP family inorganic anion transporter [Gemmatimonadales bacterium]|nr:SulP family inorganic anion transporter [Gemmatimonadales bacterium]